MLRFQTKMYCFTQGDAILILENTLKNDLGHVSFSVVVSDGHVPASGHHIPGCCLLNVCTAFVWYLFLLSWKCKSGHHSYSMHVNKLLYLCSFFSQSCNDRGFLYKCVWNMSFSALEKKN